MICNPEEGGTRQPLGWSPGGEASPGEEKVVDTVFAITGCLKFLFQPIHNDT